ncbi:MAG: YbaB/EbfC family nucleoid-associated protein [Actinoallomurus sp.]
MADSIGEALHELRAEIEKVRLLEARLDQVSITRSAGDEVVTATVTGTGRLTGLHINDVALQTPTKIGSMVRSAISRARNASSELREAARSKHFPEYGSAPTIDTVFSEDLDTSEFDLVDIDGSWRANNEIAENIEAYNKVAKINRLCKRRYLSQDVGNGSGKVVMSVDGSKFDVQLDTNAPRQVGLDRLARQVVDAISQAEQQAEQVRNRELAKIEIDGFSLGERLLKMQRIRRGLE